MIKNGKNIEIKEVAYVSPKCVEHVMQMEGALCASIQQLSEDSEYTW